MRIYHKYILKKIIFAFFTSILVFTSILIVLYLLRISKKPTIGLHFLTVVKLIIYLNSFLLAFSIPMSMLIATLLVFGRLSADNEIVALRASGINPLKIVSSPIIFAIIISFISLLVLGEAAPLSHLSMEKLVVQAIDPAALFEPGKTIKKFASLSIQTKSKHGNKLYGITITQTDRAGQTVHIDSKWGEVIDRRTQGKVALQLYDVDSYIPVGEKEKKDVIRAHYKMLEIEFDLRQVLGDKAIIKDKDDLTIKELILRSRIAAEKGDSAITYVFELHKRFVLASSCLWFVFIGIPLGIRIHRGEKTVGTAIGLALALAYYYSIIAIEKLIRHQFILPTLIVWVPSLLLILIGIFLFRRMIRGAK